MSLAAIATSVPVPIAIPTLKEEKIFVHIPWLSSGLDI